MKVNVKKCKIMRITGKKSPLVKTLMVKLWIAYIYIRT